MKPTAGSSQSLIKLPTSMRSGLSAKIYMLSLVLSFIASGVFAQTVTWSESYQQGVAPTTEQHQRWMDFLASLEGKKFASVTLSGTFDETGKTLADPAAVNNLAALLASGTVGSVVSNGQTWTVTNCDIGNGVFGIGLKVDGTGTSCFCEDAYALRPLSQSDDWGGVNSPPSQEGQSCSVVSQTLKLVFYSGVKVVAEGPTEICEEGGSVVLKAQSDICSGSLTYKWSNGATTESIEVKEAGIFSVTVWGDNGCTATSAPLAVNATKVSVVASAGLNGIYCDQPVPLTAVGASAGGKETTTVQKFCLFDSPGISGGTNCEYTAESICIEGQTVFPEPVSFSTTVSIENPVEVRYILYYTSWSVATFKFQLNGEPLDTFVETTPVDDCEVAVPRTFVFKGSQIAGWKPSQPNTLTLEASADQMLAVAGFSIEVVTSNVSYSWTPADGLDLTTIAEPMATPTETKDYIVAYTDANNCKATDTVTVRVQCGDSPVASCQAITRPVGPDCQVTVSAADFNLGSSSPSNLPLEYFISQTSFPVGTHNVTFKVTDSNNNSDECYTTITVTDGIAPAIAQPAELTGIAVAGTCSVTIPLVAPTVTDCSTVTVVHNQQDDVFDVGTTTVTWTVTDTHGNTATQTQLVTVTGTAPVITSIVGPISPVAVGSNAVLAITYADDNFSHSTIDWGDGSPATVLNNPVLSFEAGHSYASVGTYAVTITLTDMCGAEVTTVYEPIDVFDPRSGSVNGGGRFDSHRGAYLGDPQAAGIANYSFDARYNGFSNVPEGSASFKFKTGNLKFSSTRFDLLLIDGETARLTGSGSVNDKPGYNILISMVDDDTKLPRDKKTKIRKIADRIRVMITDPMGEVIYDTQLGDANDAVATTHITSGSIEIDNSTNTFTDEVEDFFDSGFSDESTSVYPNPFIDYVNVQFVTESTQDVVVTMMDISGQVLHSQEFAASADAIYTLDVPDTANEGIYLVIIRQGARIEILTVVKN